MNPDARAEAVESISNAEPEPDEVFDAPEPANEGDSPAGWRVIDGAPEAPPAPEPPPALDETSLVFSPGAAAEQAEKKAGLDALKAEESEMAIKVADLDARLGTARAALKDIRARLGKLERGETARAPGLSATRPCCRPRSAGRTTSPISCARSIATQTSSRRSARIRSLSTPPATARPGT